MVRISLRTISNFVFQSGNNIGINAQAINAYTFVACIFIKILFHDFKPMYGGGIFHEFDLHNNSGNNNLARSSS